MTSEVTDVSRAERIARFLTDEGFRPAIDDGDVSFKYQGRRLFVAIDEKDEDYYRVMKLDFWPIESGAERRAARWAASEAGRKTKGVKIFLHEDDVSASVDLLVPDVDSLLKVLLRAVELCAVGAERFGELVGQFPDEEEADETTGSGAKEGA